MDERTLLVVDRGDISTAEVRTEALGPLADGHVRLQIDRLALTANTVTYAQFGDMLGYWGFYPVELPWGAVPAIGWATVVASQVPGVEVGLHVYGWWPMATTVDIEAAPVAGGFRDVGAHRADHAPTYRTYLSGASVGRGGGADPEAEEDAEDRHALLRGLAATGALIASYLGQPRFAGVEQVLVLSASSKTAIGYASAARRARVEGDGPLLVGITSEANRPFVEGLGLYDEVRTYGSLADGADAAEGVAERPTAIVDMAGAADAIVALHAQLGDQIVHSMVVGKSHHDDPFAEVVGGPTPELFFAPAEIERLAAELGADRLQAELADAAAAMVEASRTWLRIEHRHGPDQALAAWADALAGRVPPDVGVIFALA
ncbi:MAG: DUF2855 family protein [Acidimicrobiales bacterium]